MRSIAVLGLGVLVGCGSGGEGRAESPRIIVSVTLAPDHSAAAVTYWETGEPTHVRVRPDQLGSETFRSVLIHELAHAVGVPGHLGVGCYLYENAGWMEPGDPPCDEEREAVEGRAGVYEVEVVGDSALFADVAFACEFWRFWTGDRVRFVFAE
jgi:hypothetical protein